MSQEKKNIKVAVEERRGALRKLADQASKLVHDNRRLLVIAACLVLFIYLLIEVNEKEFNRIDRIAYWVVVEHLRFDWLTPIMESFSALATPVTLLVLLLAVAAFAPGRRPGWCCAVNLGLVVLLNQVMKFIIQRPRPEGFRLVDVSGYSFPSGHSMVSMAFFGLLAWFVWKYEKDKHMRNLLVLAFAGVICMVGLSRVYLGVHYATDVLAGFAVSLIWLALYTRLAVPLFMGDEDLPISTPNSKAAQTSDTKTNA